MYHNFVKHIHVLAFLGVLLKSQSRPSNERGDTFAPSVPEDLNKSRQLY